jgi:hypothetical protein
MSEETELTVRRTTSYADRRQAYRVEVDGVVVGSVRARDSVTIPIKPGAHTLVLRINWCGSEQTEFEAQPSESVTFECGSNLTGWRLLLASYYIVFRTRQYLWLRRVE